MNLIPRVVKYDISFLSNDSIDIAHFEIRDKYYFQLIYIRKSVQ